MTTTALTGGFAVCQTRLGAKVHDPKDPGLGPRADVPPGRGHDPAGWRPRHPERWLQINGQPRRPGLRLRADRRSAAARGEHPAPAVRVPRGSLALADTWAGCSPRRLPRRSSSWRPRRASWPTPRRAGWASTAEIRRIGSDGASGGPTTHEMAEPLAGFHFPDDVWARVIYDLVVTTGRLERATGEQPPRRRRPRALVAALVPIYFGRVGQLRRREPGPHDRRGRGAGRAPGPRVRAAQAVSRRSAGGRRRRCGPEAPRPGPLPVRILIPVANPVHGRGARPDRRRAARAAGRRAAGAGHRRGARGNAAVRGRDPRPPGPAPPPAGPRLRPGRRDDPSDRPDRPTRRRGDRRGGRRAGRRPDRLRLGGRHTIHVTTRRPRELAGGAGRQ